MSGLNGKVAVVTGATSGIGLAITQRFVKEGAHVFMDRPAPIRVGQGEALSATAQPPYGGDATSTGRLDRLFQTVRAEKGKLDILVANSGSRRAGGIREGHRGQLRQDLRPQRSSGPFQPRRRHCP